MKNLYLLILFFLPTIMILPQQKIGKHTTAEWRHIIDTTWGVGISTIDKLKIFDTFWNAIDQKYAGFQGIEDNWYKLKSYRDTIALGVSRGRFQGILDHLIESLHDGHVYMLDNGIESTPLKPGVPLLFSTAVSSPSYYWNVIEHFGAALTPLADSTLLVFSAVKNHPLGLVPGDVVLGYDGKQWKDLYKELIEVQFPIPIFYVSAGSERAITHGWLQSAGMNWHLFDTIDIVKYSTGDTLHLPTDLLSSPISEIHSNEQMPVEGIHFPVGAQNLVSWGFIKGTKIGYIYLWGETYPSVSQDFLTAINAMMPDSSSEGLIIDMRLNEGGSGGSLDYGFRKLFNQDMEPMLMLTRSNPSDHLAMKDAGVSWFHLTGTDNQLYDRPIAVLCGPACISGGDMGVQCLRQHPMVRTFGLPTNGAFGSYSTINEIPSGWTTGICDLACYIPPDIKNILIHKSIPVDEEVWLTKDGVAKGEDDVVKKALEWINNLVYGHKLQLNRTAVDTLQISAEIENPNSHQISSKAYIKNLEGNFVDSLELRKVGKEWIGNYTVPEIEDIFNISLSTFDFTDSKTFKTDNISRFTTAGPVILEDIKIYYSQRSYDYKVSVFVHNKGSIATITNASVKLTCQDPWMKSISPNIRTLPDISPDSIVQTSSSFSITFDGSKYPGYFNFKVEILSDGWTLWDYTLKAVITGTKRENQLPLTFNLDQNYPNPFNPSTTIKYSIPAQTVGNENFRSVHLIIYDVLGREVATLVNEEKPAGTYEVTWNAANFPSGVYFYQLKAGNFTATKKLLLLK